MWSPLGLWMVIIQRCLMKMIFSTDNVGKYIAVQFSVGMMLINTESQYAIYKDRRDGQLTKILNMMSCLPGTFSDWNLGGTIQSGWIWEICCFGALWRPENGRWSCSLLRRGELKNFEEERSLFSSSLNSKFFKTVFYSRLVARCSLALAGTVVVLIRCRRLGEDSSKKSV